MLLSSTDTDLWIESSGVGSAVCVLSSNIWQVLFYQTHADEPSDLGY